MPLLESLLACQERTGQNDKEFGAYLGFSGQFWGQVKAGKRRITVAVLRAVLRRFPELKSEVLAFLEEPEPAGKREKAASAKGERS